MNAVETKFATITVQHDIPEERVRDLFCSAWEGGSTYWCGLKKRKVTKKADAIISKLVSERHQPLFGYEYPFIPGVDVLLYDVGDEEDSSEDEPEQWTLNRDKLIAGLQVMATKYPEHFANFLAENDDAETGDVYLQCCLFGEIVYG